MTLKVYIICYNSIIKTLRRSPKNIIFFVKIYDKLNKSIDFKNYSRRDISIDLHLTDNQLTTNIASDDLG